MNGITADITTLSRSQITGELEREDECEFAGLSRFSLSSIIRQIDSKKQGILSASLLLSTLPLPL